MYYVAGAHRGALGDAVRRTAVAPDSKTKSFSILEDESGKVPGEEESVAGGPCDHKERADRP